MDEKLKIFKLKMFHTSVLFTKKKIIIIIIFFNNFYENEQGHVTQQMSVKQERGSYLTKYSGLKLTFDINCGCLTLDLKRINWTFHTIYG